MKKVNISVISASQKVMREQKIINNKLKKARFVCPQNGHEAIQIVITANEDISNFSLRIGNFTGKNGVIGADNFSVYRENYAEVMRPTANNRYIHPLGYYPDALIPYDIAQAYGEMHIEKGHNQAIYIELFTKNIKKGRYNGCFIVEAEGESLTIDSQVNVFGIEVPDKVNLQTLFLMREKFISIGEGSMEKQLIEKYYDFFLEYRINPYTFPVKTKEVKEFTDYVQRYYDNPKLSGYGFPSQLGGGGGIFDYALLKNQILAVAALSTKGRNLLDKAFIKNGDEPELNEQVSELIETEKTTHELLESIAEKIKQDNSGKYDGFKSNKDWYSSITDMCINVPVAQTWTTIEPMIKKSSPKIEMLSLINSWCPLIDAFDYEYGKLTHASFDKLQPRGKLWCYTANGPVWPYPSYHIDDSMLSPRMLNWIIYNENLAGNLHWAPVCFSNNCRPINVTKYEVPYREGGYACPSGEGFLVYPGKKYNHFGPLPSLRLKNNRNGMEDYEILRIFEQKIGKFCESIGEKDYDAKSVINTYTDRIICGAQYYDDVKSFDEIRSSIYKDAAEYDKSNVKIVKVVHDKDNGLITLFARNGVVPNGEYEKHGTYGKWTKYIVTLKYNEKINYLIAGKNKFYISTKRDLISTFDNPIDKSLIDVSKDSDISFTDGKWLVNCINHIAPRDLEFIPGVYFKTQAIGRKILNLKGTRFIKFTVENVMEKTSLIKVVLYADDGYIPVYESYVMPGKTEIFIRTDRIDWTKLNRVTGIGLEFSCSLYEKDQKINFRLHELTVIE